MMLYGLLFGLCADRVVVSHTAGARWSRDGRACSTSPTAGASCIRSRCPMLGGVAVFISFYVCLWLVGTQLESPSARSAFQLASAMFVPSLLILGLGIVDDKWSVGPWVKIAVQIVAGLLVYLPAGHPHRHARNRSSWRQPDARPSQPRRPRSSGSC